MASYTHRPPEGAESAGVDDAADSEDVGLAVISDETIDRIEGAVFQRIGGERARAGRRRRTAWISASAAAAVIVVAAVIAPSIQAGIAGGSAGTAGSIPAVDAADGGVSAPDAGEGVKSEASDGGAADAGSELMDSGTSAADNDAARDVITTASASVTVDDVRAGSDRVAALAEAAGGWVESLQLGTSSQPLPIDVQGGAPDVASATYGWISIRVPSADLQTTVTALSDIGDVTAVDISRQDVTQAAVDMRARIDSLEASVDRLTELMAQSGSVGDLIAAESALSERQAELESLTQQLEQLEGQVEMSTLTVSLAKTNVAVEADPAGFGDGFIAGWNAVVATLNGVVIAVGFLIPWIVILAVLTLAVWGVVRLARRTRSRSPRATETPSSPEE